MESVKIFDEKFHKIIKDSVKSVLLEGSENLDLSPIKENLVTKTESNLTCSYCRVEFANAQLQREHYKLDWHRYNLKQSLLGKQSINEDEFVIKTGKDDLSSISGSDSDREDTLDTYATAQGKIFLQAQTGQVFSMYRCLVFDRKEETSDLVLLQRLKNCCITHPKWTILMLGGGHFAGAVFEGNTPILHKTFHCYTVRAGQGGSQSSRDNKSGGSHPKSAGASLRRYNEQAFIQHISGIVDAWRQEISQSTLIFYRASGSFNRSVLFGGGSPILERSDNRLRTIPFSTRRATFTEVQRVQSLLSQAQVYDSLDVASDSFSKQKLPEGKRNKSRLSCINRAKSRETVERPLPGQLSSGSSSENVAETFEDLDLVTEDAEISFEGLKTLDDSLTWEQRKKTPKKKKAPKKSKTKKLREKEEARKREISDVLTRGDLTKLQLLLDNYVKTGSELNSGDESVEGEKAPKLDSDEVKNAFVNAVLDENCNTLLHLAVLNEHNEVVVFLLENNANPCLKNKMQQTAYTCNQNKEIRETLKQFARDNPEKYNYNKAQIPVSTLTIEEMADKKKAQRQVKREKEKEKRKENEVKRKEQTEKDRFLLLTDREKRALAAERRILSQSGAVIARCFLCASDMAGKVPFEYLGNRFCTIDCLKAHRLSHNVIK